MIHPATNMGMLYDAWREVARERSSETALRDLSTGRSWTFSQLLTTSDNCAAPGEPWVFPRGNQPEFIFHVLQAWRHNRVLCPLEPSDPTPAAQSLPPGIVHVKRTSATTGPARQVIFTAAQLSADPANICRTMGLRPDWPNLGVISLAHSYGFSNLVLPLLLHGIPLHLVQSPLPEVLRTALQSHPAFTLPSVPALWRAWFQAGVLSTNIQLAISAGAPLPLQLERDVFETSAIKIHNFLGASECGGIAYDRTAAPRPDPSLAGTAFNGVELSARDGVLLVRSPAVARGYWPESAEGPKDGSFRTSDLVEIRDGVLYMRGRATDLMNIAGRKVSPDQIEQALLTHPSVSECIVFDAPRKGEENQIVAVVAGQEIDVAVLKAHLAVRLPPWQLPRQWIPVDSLEANARGKISRKHWRDRFLAGQI